MCRRPNCTTSARELRTGFPLAYPVPSLTLFTDASLLGWGGYLEGQTVSPLEETQDPSPS
jgi:hypothetical protein